MIYRVKFAILKFMPRIARAVAVNYPHHIKKSPDSFLSDGCYLTDEIKDWSKYLRGKEDASLIKEIRQNTKKGRPCGDDKFLLKIENITGRRSSSISTEKTPEAGD